jgi:ATP-dependent RNA helicase DeaD
MPKKISEKSPKADVASKKSFPTNLKSNPRPDAAKSSVLPKHGKPANAALNRAARRAALRESYEAVQRAQGQAPKMEITAQNASAPQAAAVPKKFKPDFKPEASKRTKPKSKKREPEKRELEKQELEKQELDKALPEEAPREVAGEVLEESASFDTLGLNEATVRAIAALGFEAPTPIQARAIPVLLQGHDLIGQAQTGTGKTAAFALPIIQNIDLGNAVPQALVLAPTRELAVQVAGGIHDLAKGTNLRVVPVYGGQPIDRQFRALNAGAHVVVGTPGRLIDHLRRDSLSLENVKFCVLDEADEMLALGFLEEVEEILAALPVERQTAFFSATMPPRMTALIKRFLRAPEHVVIGSKKRTVEAIEQTYYEVPKGQKLEALARVLDMETPGPTIVFCHTRQETNDLSEALRLRGYNAEALNGEMGQNDRDRVLRRFREGVADLLVATDVAARGLDIETVTHVINYSIPWDVEQYIHRIGRTGRAGRSGDAITLIEPKEVRKLKLIERMTGVKMKSANIPTAADIAARRRDAFKDALREALQEDEFHSELATVEELGEEFDASQIAAAALHLLWQSRHSEESAEADLAADYEQPESGMTRIFVGLGKQDGLRPGELVATIANQCGLPGKVIGAIDILDRSSFVEVPSAQSEHVIEVLRRSPLRGKKVKIDLATPRH